MYSRQAATHAHCLPQFHRPQSPSEPQTPQPPHPRSDAYNNPKQRHPPPRHNTLAVVGLRRLVLMDWLSCAGPPWGVGAHGIALCEYSPFQATVTLLQWTHGHNYTIVRLLQRFAP